MPRWLAPMMMPSRAGVSPVSIQLATWRQEICPCRRNRRELTVMRTPAWSKFSIWAAPASGRPLRRSVRLPWPSGVFPRVRKLVSSWSDMECRAMARSLLVAGVCGGSGSSAWAGPTGAETAAAAGFCSGVPDARAGAASDGLAAWSFAAVSCSGRSAPGCCCPAGVGDGVCRVPVPGRADGSGRVASPAGGAPAGTAGRGGAGRGWRESAARVLSCVGVLSCRGSSNRAGWTGPVSR